MEEYLTVFVLAAWFTASVFPLVFGGVGYGISGANATFAGWETLYRGGALVSILRTQEVTETIVPYARHGLALTAVGSLTLLALLRAAGSTEASAGASVIDHLVGAALGIYLGVHPTLVVYLGQLANGCALPLSLD